MPYRSRPGVLVVSIILAAIVGYLVPTPNNTNGGTAKMILLIFLMVIFKAVIEFVLGRFRKKTDKLSQNDAPEN
jgi:hypothetical protein